jgi:DNA-directed RNA polymerase specialized sigma subunit
MTAKEYLSELKRLDICIDQKLKELDDLRTMSTGVQGIDYSTEKVKTSPSPDAPFVRIIDKMVSLNDEINAEIDRFAEEKHKIINEIQSLSNEKHIEILYARYVEFKSLELVAGELGYTYQYIILLHGYALKEFSKKFQYKFNV